LGKLHWYSHDFEGWKGMEVIESKWKYQSETVLLGLAESLSSEDRAKEAEIRPRLLKAWSGFKLSRFECGKALDEYRAFRRSELASILEVEDLAFTEGGLDIRLRRSKTDQGMQGRNVAVPMGEHPETCPVRALRSWLEAAAITSGPIFRSVDRHGHVAAHALSPRSIAKILKCAATRAGIDATLIAGHSLRAGMATQAALNGSNEREIARTTGHHSDEMVKRYIRLADPFQAIGATQLGL
jgi:hypothetical protein